VARPLSSNYLRSKGLNRPETNFWLCLYRRSGYTTVVNAFFGHFDIFIPLESSLHRASNDAIIFVVLQLESLSKMQIS